MRLTYLCSGLLSLALASMAISGCSSNSTTPEAPPPTITPAAGSYFLFQRETQDSTGRIVSLDTSKETISQTGLTIYGKTDVIEIIDSAAGTLSKPSYIHYEANGDVSSYEGPQPSALGVVDGWSTYPFGSQSTHTYSFDTTIGQEASQGELTTAGAGRGNIIIHGTSIITEKITFNISSKYTYAGQTSTSTINSTLEFAPALGEVVREDFPGTRDVNGALENSAHEVVFDYVLK